ncbi:MAG TPA: type II toxin-antitoxin system VapC family toxin, partial [Candidatus Angelobacter sp.]|nr:type II toxin-antitoxin system VapC family toxin [Candidatus Angelobacter sp.]
MVLDTSALLAIFLNQPERDTFLAAIIGAARRLVSVATVLETGIVLEARKGEAAGRELDLFLHAGAIEQVAVDVEQLELARLAFRRYGKDR